MTKPREKFYKELLVEGINDLHVVSALCEKYQIPENFEIVDCAGIDNLRKQISVRFKSSGIDTIGVIVDADTDILQRWEVFSAVLKEEGFNVPLEFPVAGLILKHESQNKKVGVWIMPDNQTSGMLEDFIAFLVPEDDLLIPEVHTVLGSIESKGINKYTPIHKSKAVIHTWLAWQENPGTPMGLSITKKYLTTEDAVCESFVNWLTNLFS